MESIYNMNCEKPIISANFYLSGKHVDLTAITETLKIKPTRTRKMEDWPKSAKKAGLACDLWVLSTENEHSKSVSDYLRKLANQIADREDEIIGICKQYNLETNIEIVIHMNSMSGPEVVLNKALIKLFASINAEVGFDIYTY